MLGVWGVLRYRGKGRERTKRKTNAGLGGGGGGRGDYCMCPIFNTKVQCEPFNFAPLFKAFNDEDVPLGEFMYLLFTRMPGESYRR